jgi:hypothetical protein
MQQSSLSNTKLLFITRSQCMLQKTCRCCPHACCTAAFAAAPSDPTVCLECFEIFSKIAKLALFLNSVFSKRSPAPPCWLHGTIEGPRCWQQPVEAGEGFYLCIFPGSWIDAKARVLIAEAALYTESLDKVGL